MLFVYFSGHCLIDKETYLILNGENVLFPVERMIKGLSCLKDTVVFGLFSCGKLMMWSGEKDKEDK